MALSTNDNERLLDEGVFHYWPDVRGALPAVGRGGLFLYLIPNFLRMKEDHRSALLSHQGFDHPPPVGLSGRTRRSKSDLDDRTRNVCFNPMSGGLHQR